jgi:hypothetical protein
MPGLGRHVAGGDCPRQTRSCCRFEHGLILRELPEGPQSLLTHFFFPGCQSKIWILPFAGETRTTDCRSTPSAR